MPVVPLAATVAESVRAGTAHWPIPPVLVTEVQDKFDAFAASRAALTKSGTSTLELALAGVPMVVTYRVNPLTYAIAKRVTKVKYASIINLLADQEIIPELIQQDATPDRLAGVLNRLLTDRRVAAAQVEAYQAPLAMLRPAHGTPSEAAAAAVLALLG